MRKILCTAIVAAIVICSFSSVSFASSQATILKTMNFSDLSGHWAESYVREAVDRGFMKGYPDGSFQPERGILREEVMQILYNLHMDKTPPKEHPHVSTRNIVGHWYERPVSFFLKTDTGLDHLVFDRNYRFINGQVADRDFFINALIAFGEKYYAEKFDATNNRVEKAISLGLINGFPDGLFHGEKPITRSQAAKIINLYANLVGIETSPDPEEFSPFGKERQQKNNLISRMEKEGYTLIYDGFVREDDPGLDKGIKVRNIYFQKESEIIFLDILIRDWDVEGERLKSVYSIIYDNDKKLDYRHPKYWDLYPILDEYYVK
ncbi:S-layer homology domain-containing protein [Clostridiales bacterium COT073_COT-073]|nr:S-layer homology domain-containing protein [Clostridiales bacterium COT073_COT-073]